MSHDLPTGVPDALPETGPASLSDEAVSTVPLQSLQPADAISRVLFEAVVAMSSDLDLHSVLTRIVQSAAELTGARYGALGVIGTGGVLDDFVTHGIDEEEQETIGALPRGHGILGLLIRHPEPLRLTDIQAHPESYGFPDAHPPMKNFLGVPVRIRGTVFGNLYLTEKSGGFTADDITLVQTLATAAGVGIERAQASADRASLAVLSDRERIARDLHDVVIQRLFATGLSLQGLAIKAPEVSDQIGRTVEALDQTIRDIRGTIFELQHRGGSSLRAELREIIREHTVVLGFHPMVRVEGPVDTVIPGPIREHLAAVLREGLSNIARHARSTGAEVALIVQGDHVRFTLRDNGVGIKVNDDQPRSGLRNMIRRATDSGGTCEMTALETGGSELVWQVPLRPRT